MRLLKPPVKVLHSGALLPLTKLQLVYVSPTKSNFKWILTEAVEIICAVFLYEVCRKRSIGCGNHICVIAVISNKNVSELTSLGVVINELARSSNAVLTLRTEMLSKYATPEPPSMLDRKFT